MKKLKSLPHILVITFCFLLFTFNSFSQSVGINSTGVSPDASALLDLSATDKGFLITRVDTLNITLPAFGLMTLSPVDSCLYLYNGLNWMGMGGGGSNCDCNCSNLTGTPSEFSCGVSSFTDTRDNETYGTVKIGKQCWMNKNLNYTPSSGDSWCYDNNVNNCNIYGRLYEWNTATNSSSSSNNPSGVQGVCPTGWHVPSDAEWKELEMELGMTQAIADVIGWRGNNEGEQLKASSFGGNNASGFTALPGGIWNPNTGAFHNVGTFGIWWTATAGAVHGYSRSLIIGQSYIGRSNIGFVGDGHSVRCVKD